MKTSEAEKLKKKIQGMRWQRQYVDYPEWDAYKIGWRDLRDKVLELIEREKDRG